jgi:ADP-ribosyl-[dinitrogen reductase] hydrolase
MHSSEKIMGCILGGAIGDCMGGPYEGRNPPFQIYFDHKWKLSDDTLLTLATCEAISNQGRIDPAAIADFFTSWFKQGRLVGLGASTYKALSELSQGGHWALVGRKGEMAAGNGAAMRIAPLAFYLDPTERDSRTLVHDVCRITHHNEEAYVGALAVMLAVHAAWNETWNGQGSLIEFVIGYLPDSSVRDRLIDLAEMKNEKPLREVATKYGSSGYVVESVPLALLGAELIGTLGFPTMLEELVACGGDTDTIASIAGQIAGTLIGKAGLPKEMLERLPALDLISKIAQEFCTLRIESACK